MRIEPRSIKVRDVFECYADNGDDGVFAYGGKLAIRPPYQREFVYDNAQSEAVIQTVLKGFPLNVMYWVKVGDEQYEVLDGQQRTLSVMQYLKHKFPITIDGSNIIGTHCRMTNIMQLWTTNLWSIFARETNRKNWNGLRL